MSLAAAPRRAWTMHALSARAQPNDETAALLTDVQGRALRGIVWALLAYVPVQLAVWHRNPIAERSWASIAVEVILLAASAAQFLAVRRLGIRASGLIFVTWLSVVDTISWFHGGATMGLGVAMACTILVAIFFVGRRAGGVVLAGLGAMMLLHVPLHQGGHLGPSPAWPGNPTALTMLRTVLTGLAPLAFAYVSFAMIHRALFRALERSAEERRQRDLAEAARQRAEDTMRANQHFEALGKLTSGVAHDVNNALTAVLCHAELLLDDESPTDRRQRAHDILAAAQSAAQTTRQLLSLNRRAFCQPANVDPARVAATVTRLVGRLMPGNIHVRVAASTQRLILVDPADLQQALLNLLLNSRDAMPEGGEIVVEISERDSGTSTQSPFATVKLVSTHHVLIRVRDTGRGIPPETQARIFDPFFTTKASGKGTGLGLAMVKAFVEEAGGTVAVESQPGAGTCLTLRFPESREPAAGVGAGADALAAPTGQSILLIEDEPNLRGLMERSLQRGGYRVTSTATVEEALALLAGGQAFDLLCSDGLKGRTPIANLIARFRAQNPAAPVILCSGHIDQDFAPGDLGSLRVGLLRKPFTGTELLACVRRTHCPPTIPPTPRSGLPQHEAF